MRQHARARDYDAKSKVQVHLKTKNGAQSIMKKKWLLSQLSVTFDVAKLLKS